MRWPLTAFFQTVLVVLQLMRAYYIADGDISQHCHGVVGCGATNPNQDTV